MLFLWLAASHISLGLIHRSFHRRLQAVLLLFFRRTRPAYLTYAALLFPGVALHELSHWTAARVLGVQVHAFSLLPKRQPGDLIRFGYVETGRVDPIRSTLIGLAPFVTGVAALIALGFYHLGLDEVGWAMVQGDWARLWAQIERLLSTPDLALWIYLIVAVSNTMMPSSADRSNWLPTAAILAGLAALLFGLGYGQQAIGWLVPGLVSSAQILASVFTLTAVLDLALILPLSLMARFLAAVTGYEVG